MEPRVVGQLRVEGRGQDGPFPHRHRVVFICGQHLHLGSASLDPGGTDEDRAQGLVPDPGDREVGLEALQLATEGVAADAGVDEAKVLGIADDHPGAGAEDRPAGLVVGPQRRLEPGGIDSLADRGALAAGNDEAVEPLEVGRETDLADLGAELAQDPGVRVEVALDR